MSNVSRMPYGWRMEKLGNLLAKIVGGGTPSREKESFWNGSIPWATVKDLRKPILHITEESITEEALKESASNLIPKNTLIIATRMALGKAVFFSQDVAINQDLKALFPVKGLDRQFLFHWFQHQAEVIERLGSGSTVKGIRLEVLRGLDVALPSLAEQQKIAEILSTVDEKIAVIDEQLAKTAELKTGLMQRLLTKGIGHTMFKDSPLGEIPESWEVVQLEKLVDKERPIRYGIVQTGEHIIDGIPCLRVADFSLRQLEKEKMIRTSQKISESYPSTVLVENDIVFPLRGQIGNVRLIKKELQGINLTRGVALISYSDKIFSEYLLWQIRSPAVRKEILLKVNGTTLQEIPITSLKKVLVPVAPPTEQRQIAELLSTVDEKIQVLRDKKEHYQTLKRGLMQQLLTGKLRVRITEDVVPV